MAKGSEHVAGAKPFLAQPRDNPHNTAQVLGCPDTSSHLDDGVTDAPSLLAEHTVFEGLVHYNIGHFLQVHITGVCREEKYCQEAALFGP